MGRRKTVAQLTQQLTYAKNRAAYKPPVREVDAAITARPQGKYKYKVLSPFAPATATLTINGSTNAIKFVGDGNEAAGLTTLGLAAQDASPTPPRGFRPAQIKMVIGTNSPTLVRATASKRPYTRYTRGTRGDNRQHSYLAPVCAEAITGIDERVRTVLDKVQNQLGGTHGTFTFEMERFPFTGGGTAAPAPA